MNMTRALMISLALAVSACNEKAPRPEPAAAVDPDLVVAGAALESKIKLAKVEVGRYSDLLRVAGHIDFDEQNVARIGTAVSGRVAEIVAEPGSVVRKGEVLARLHSSELGAVQLAYLKAASGAELHRQSRDRARQLFAADVIGSAELERRQSELSVSQAELRAYQDQLQMLGMSASEIAELRKNGAIHSVTPVVSTIGGTVVERKIARGQVVQPSDSLLTVADLSKVWAIAEVPEQQVALVTPGMSVSVEIPALDHQKLVGKLIYVGQTVNPATRTVTVRTELDNSAGKLKPAMLCAMLIEGRPSDVPVLPAAAVFRDENRDWVFREERVGQYRAVAVELGNEANGVRPVLSGIKAGERIVVDGVFHLENERKKKEL